MLRALLLVSPLTLALASCGDSTATFDDSRLPGDTGATGAVGDDGGGNAGDAQDGGAPSADTARGGGSGTSAAGTVGDGGSENTTQGGTQNGKAGSGGADVAGSNSGAAGSSMGGSSSGAAGSSMGGSSSSGSSGSGGLGGVSNQGGSSGAAGSAGTAGSSGGRGPGWGGWPNTSCADIAGTYDIASAEGCNGINKDAPQAIEQADRQCAARFVSLAPTGNSAINGNATLADDGSFSGAALTVGKTLRSPCSGVWDPGHDRMTIECGYLNDLCTAVLERR